MQNHWVLSKCHRLWFSTKTCSCHSTKTHVNSIILILKLNLTSLSTTHILMYMFLTEVKFNLRMRITRLHAFSLSNNYMTSLRTTSCDALIVPSENSIDVQSMTICRPMNHLNETRSLKDRQHLGWPRKISTRKKRYLMTLSRRYRYQNARKVVCCLPDAFETRICSETARNRLVWTCLKDVHILTFSFLNVTVKRIKRWKTWINSNC